MQNTTQGTVRSLLLTAAWSFMSASTLAVGLVAGSNMAWAEGTGGHKDGGGTGGHDDGGHDDGGHEDGGHEDGGGEDGHAGGGGKGKKHKTPPVLPALGVSEGGGAGGEFAGNGTANYVRIDLGGASGSAGSASWRPSGFPADPQVFFDLDGSSSPFAGFALGRSYGNGWRAEAALSIFGKSDYSGPWSYTIPDTAGPHADMEATVTSMALMANGNYDFETVGKVTPFLTAGLGMSRNSIDSWTRINPDAGRTTRSFTGGSDTGLAWSAGLGMSVDVGPVLGSGPAKLELAWRYFDLGSVTGGSTPLPGSGSGGEPVTPLNFDITSQVVSIGLRIPLN